MKLVFAGTPEVAVPALDALIASGRHEVAAVVTRPDAPAGRGRRLVASPVARAGRGGGDRGAQARAGPGTRSSWPGCGRSRPTAAPSSRTGRCCPASPSTSPPTAGSTCTSRCCPPGAAPRPCSTPSWRGTRSPAPPPSSSRRGSTPGPVYGTVTEEVRPTDTSGDLLTRLAFAGAGLLAATMDGIEDGTLQGRAAARRGRHARAEDHRRGRARRLVGARAARRPGGARVHARARRLDRLPRRAAQAHPGRARARAHRPRPGRAGRRQEQRVRRHRLARRGAAVGPGPGQEADARRRLGARGADRRRRAARGAASASGRARRRCAPRGPGRRRAVRWRPHRGTPSSQHPEHLFRERAAPVGRAGPASPTAVPRRTPSASSPSRRCGPWTSGTRTPTSCCRRCCGRPGSRADFDGRDAALATELVYGTLRRQGTYDAVIAACVDRPLREVDPPVLDVLEPRRAPAARHADPHATPPCPPPSSWPGSCSATGGPSSSTPCCGRSPQHDLDGWLERVAPPYDEDPEDHLAVVHSHPRWVVSALWDSLGGGRAGHRGAAGGRQRAARGHPRRPARAGHRRGAARRARRGGRAARPLVAVRRAAGRGRRARAPSTPYARAAPGVQDEGSQLVALALANAPLDGPDQRVAGRLRRARRQGRAARRARRRARGRAARRREAAAPGAARREGAGRQSRARTRSSPPTARARRGGRAPSTGCWWTCPCTGLGRAAAPARGALAAPARGPGRLRAAPARAAAHGAGRRCASAASSATPPARRTSPRPARSSTTCSSSTAPRAELHRRPAPAAGRTGAGRRARRPAVAASARHRRDVPGAAPPHGLKRGPHLRTLASEALLRRTA